MKYRHTLCAMQHTNNPSAYAFLCFVASLQLHTSPQLKAMDSCGSCSQDNKQTKWHADMPPCGVLLAKP